MRRIEVAEVMFEWWWNGVGISEFSHVRSHHNCIVDEVEILLIQISGFLLSICIWLGG